MIEKMKLEDGTNLRIKTIGSKNYKEIMITADFHECEHFDWLRDNFLDNDETEFYLTKEEAKELGQKLIEWAEDKEC